MFNQEYSLDAASAHQAERDIILGLIYLEREARVARLLNLAKTIKSSMSDYLSARRETDEDTRTEQ
jgi:hypothetical protein